MRPSQFEVAYALLQTIGGLDLVRAQLLVEAAYRTRDGRPALTPFEQIRPETQERITYLAGQPLRSAARVAGRIHRRPGP